MKAKTFERSHKVQPLTRAEEQTLARRYQETGDQHAFHQLVERNIGIVHKCAWRLRNYPVDHDDLVQEGVLGLMHAIDKFDPNRNLRLISYAVYWINARMRNYVVSHHSLVRYGTTQPQRTLFWKLRGRLERDYAAQRVTPPEQLAQEFSVSPQDIQDCVHRLYNTEVSLDEPILVGTGQAPVTRWLTDQDALSDTRLVEEENRQIALTEIASRLLKPKEQLVIRHRYLGQNGEALAQIGKKLQISRERVRQIENNALKKLRMRVGP